MQSKFPTNHQEYLTNGIAIPRTVGDREDRTSPEIEKSQVWSEISGDLLEPPGTTRGGLEYAGGQGLVGLFELALWALFGESAGVLGGSGPLPGAPGWPH